MDKNNQANQILRLIRDSGDRGVENYKLADISLKYSSRISELRKEGYDVRAKRIWRDGKASGTFVYYLHVDEPKPAPEPQPSAAQQQAIPWMDN